MDVNYTPTMVSRELLHHIFSSAFSQKVFSTNLLTGERREREMKLTEARQALRERPPHHGVWQLDARGTRFAWCWTDLQPLPRRQHWRIEMLCHPLGRYLF